MSDTSLQHKNLLYMKTMLQNTQCHKFLFFPLNISYVVYDKVGDISSIFYRANNILMFGGDSFVSNPTRQLRYSYFSPTVLYLHFMVDLMAQIFLRYNKPRDKFQNSTHFANRGS